MDKIMNKIKKKQLLKFKDLVNISKEIHDDNCEFICENNSPFYNYKYKKMGLSADITSRWFITDYMNYAKLKDVKVLFNEEELDKIKEPSFINEDTDMYNLLLLNELYNLIVFFAELFQEYFFCNSTVFSEICSLTALISAFSSISSTYDDKTDRNFLNIKTLPFFIIINCFYI